MRRAAHLTALCLGLVCLAACAPTHVRPSGDGQWLAGRLNAAVAAKDEAAFQALFNNTGSGTRHWTWQNLVALAAVNFRVDDDVLIADWRTRPDALDVTNRVGRLACDTPTDCRVVDLGPQAGYPAPIWAVQPLAMDDASSVTVLAAPDDKSASDWLTAAQAAQQAVAGAGLGGLAAIWDGHLVIELPQDAGAMAHLLGQPSVAGYTTTGALTWVEQQPGGGPPDAGPVAHIIVNPMTTGTLTPDARILLLTHEAVHVATAGVPIAPGAVWVSEGLAESIAVAASPSNAAEEAAQARTACTAAGIQPPDDAAFGGTDAGAQTLAYARSLVLIRLIQANLGPLAMDAIASLWQGLDAPDVDLEAWSRAWCA